LLHNQSNTRQHEGIAIGYVVNPCREAASTLLYVIPDIKCLKRFSGKLSEAQPVSFCCERAAYTPYCMIFVILIIADSYIFFLTGYQNVVKKKPNPKDI